MQEVKNGRNKKMKDKKMNQNTSEKRKKIA